MVMYVVIDLIFLLESTRNLVMPRPIRMQLLFFLFFLNEPSRTPVLPGPIRNHLLTRCTSKGLKFCLDLPVQLYYIYTG